jgi:hypothetical protein
MTEKKFWEIIAASKKGERDSQERQEAALRAILSPLESDELISFDQILSELVIKAYTWDLWGAACIINDGCSDDGFEYFRRGLVASGRAKYEAALKDAETLSDWAEPDELEFESLAHIALSILKERSGAGAPQHGLSQPLEPAGEPWTEEGDDLRERFPTLWARFHN